MNRQQEALVQHNSTTSTILKELKYFLEHHDCEPSTRNARNAGNTGYLRRDSMKASMPSLPSLSSSLPNPSNPSNPSNSSTQSNKPRAMNLLTNQQAGISSMSNMSSNMSSTGNSTSSGSGDVVVDAIDVIDVKILNPDDFNRQVDEFLLRLEKTIMPEDYEVIEKWGYIVRAIDQPLTNQQINHFRYEGGKVTNPRILESPYWKELSTEEISCEMYQFVGLPVILQHLDNDLYASPSTFTGTPRRSMGVVVEPRQDPKSGSLDLVIAFHRNPQGVLLSKLLDGGLFTSVSLHHMWTDHGRVIREISICLKGLRFNTHFLGRTPLTPEMKKIPNKPAIYVNRTLVSEIIEEIPIYVLLTEEGRQQWPEVYASFVSANPDAVPLDDLVSVSVKEPSSKEPSSKEPSSLKVKEKSDNVALDLELLLDLFDSVLFDTSDDSDDNDDIDGNDGKDGKDGNDGNDVNKNESININKQMDKSSLLKPLQLLDINKLSDLDATEPVGFAESLEISSKMRKRTRKPMTFKKRKDGKCHKWDWLNKLRQKGSLQQGEQNTHKEQKASRASRAPKASKASQLPLLTPAHMPTQAPTTQPEKEKEKKEKGAWVDEREMLAKVNDLRHFYRVVKEQKKAEEKIERKTVSSISTSLKASLPYQPQPQPQSQQLQRLQRPTQPTMPVTFKASEPISYLYFDITKNSTPLFSTSTSAPLTFTISKATWSSAGISAGNSAGNSAGSCAGSECKASDQKKKNKEENGENNRNFFQGVESKKNSLYQNIYRPIVFLNEKNSFSKVNSQSPNTLNIFTSFSESKKNSSDFNLNYPSNLSFLPLLSSKFSPVRSNFLKMAQTLPTPTLPPTLTSAVPNSALSQPNPQNAQNPQNLQQNNQQINQLNDQSQQLMNLLQRQLLQGQGLGQGQGQGQERQEQALPQGQGQPQGGQLQAHLQSQPQNLNHPNQSSVNGGAPGAPGASGASVVPTAESAQGLQGLPLASAQADMSQQQVKPNVDNDVEMRSDNCNLNSLNSLNNLNNSGNSPTNPAVAPTPSPSPSPSLSPPTFSSSSLSSSSSSSSQSNSQIGQSAQFSTQAGQAGQAGQATQVTQVSHAFSPAGPAGSAVAATAPAVAATATTPAVASPAAAAAPVGMPHLMPHTDSERHLTELIRKTSIAAEQLNALQKNHAEVDMTLVMETFNSLQDNYLNSQRLLEESKYREKIATEAAAKASSIAKATIDTSIDAFRTLMLGFSPPETHAAIFDHIHGLKARGDYGSITAAEVLVPLAQTLPTAANNMQIMIEMVKKEMLAKEEKENLNVAMRAAFSATTPPSVGDAVAVASASAASAGPPSAGASSVGASAGAPTPATASSASSSLAAAAPVQAKADNTSNPVGSIASNGSAVVTSGNSGNNNTNNNNNKSSVPMSTPGLGSGSGSASGPVTSQASTPSSTAPNFSSATPSFIKNIEARSILSSGLSSGPFTGGSGYGFAAMQYSPWGTTRTIGASLSSPMTSPLTSSMNPMSVTPSPNIGHVNNFFSLFQPSASQHMQASHPQSSGQTHQQQQQSQQQQLQVQQAHVQAQVQGQVQAQPQQESSLAPASAPVSVPASAPTPAIVPAQQAQQQLQQPLQAAIQAGAAMNVGSMAAAASSSPELSFYSSTFEERHGSAWLPNQKTVSPIFSERPSSLPMSSGGAFVSNGMTNVSGNTGGISRASASASHQSIYAMQAARSALGGDSLFPPSVATKMPGMSSMGNMGSLQGSMHSHSQESNPANAGSGAASGAGAGPNAASNLIAKGKPYVPGYIPASRPANAALYKDNNLVNQMMEIS